MFFIYGRIGQYVKDAYTQLYKPSALENSAPVIIGHLRILAMSILVPIVVIQRTVICYSLHWHSVKLLL